MDPSFFRLIEAGSVSGTAAVHVDDMFEVGRNRDATGFARTLGKLIPFNNLGELRWYAGGHYSRDKPRVY